MGLSLENNENGKSREIKEAKTDLESAWFDALTQPYSIERLRDSMAEVNQAVFNLGQLIGEKQAGEFFTEMKKQFAPRYGTEPKIPSHRSAWPNHP